jgi:hypothetical protein
MVARQISSLSITNIRKYKLNKIKWTNSNAKIMGVNALQHRKWGSTKNATYTQKLKLPRYIIYYFEKSRNHLEEV